MKKYIINTAILSTFLLLTGCAGSPLWLLNNPEGKEIIIDDHEITIVPRGDDMYTSIETYTGLLENTMEFKMRHIKAVEEVSGCKVIDTEKSENMLSWHMKVNCRKRKEQ